jgi:small subunit ribosomal protein S11
MGRQRQQQRGGQRGRQGASRSRRKVRKNISTGVVHIKSSFNNTIVSVSDTEGNLIAWESAGALGFRGSRKSTPYAAQMTAESVANKAMENGVRRVDINVKGHGSGRDMAARTFQSMGIEVLKITDVTGQPHNGCRPPKRRRG